MNNRIQKIIPFLVCPICHKKITLARSETFLECSDCKKNYKIANNKIFFIEVPQVEDDLDSLKSKFKRVLGKYYYKVGIQIFAPTFPFNYLKMIHKYTDPINQIVIDIGSGNHRISEDIFCVDIFDYNAVDIVCDIKQLPFRSDSIDSICSRSVLEHVPQPELVVSDFYRVTKKGGYSIHLIPFLFPFHASPYDFTRFTSKGQEQLFGKFQIIYQTNPTGPVSALLSIFIEFLSIVFSFGQDRIKSYFYLLFCLLLFPIKYLDFLFIHRKSFLNVCASILSIYKK